MLRTAISFTVFLSLVLGMGQVVRAQQVVDPDFRNEPEKSKDKGPLFRAKWGIYGNLFGGATYGAFGDLGPDLGAPDIYDYPDFQMKGLGGTVGGQVKVLIARWVVLGFSGGRYDYDASLSIEEVPDDTSSSVYQDYTENAVRGESTIRTEFYNFHLGIAAINKRRWLFVPYVGYTLGTSKLRVRNYSQNVLNVDGTEIDQLDRTTFERSIGMLDFGVSFRRMWKDRGGFMVGAELGGYYDMAGGDWENENGTTLSNFSSTNQAGAYLRITAGGGFFWNKTEVEEGVDAYDPDMQPAAESQPAEGTAEDGMMEEDTPKKEKKKKAKKKKSTEAEGSEEPANDGME